MPVTKFATTARSAVAEKVQVSAVAALGQPVQPENVLPDVATAVSVTVVAAITASEQGALQLDTEVASVT